MAYELKKSRHFEYSNNIDALSKFIKRHWNVSCIPKGYKEFTKDYTDHKGSTELAENEEELLETFEGHDSSGHAEFSFPMGISLPTTAYNDKCQSCDPFRTLISSIFTYAMLYGQRYEQVSENSWTTSRLSHIKNTLDLQDMEEDTRKAKLYRQELEELINPGKDIIVILTKYSELRYKIDKDDLIKLLKKTFGTKLYKQKIVLHNAKYKRLHEIWETLMCISSSGFYLEFQKELKEIGLLIKHDRGKDRDRSIGTDIFTLKHSKRK